MLLVASDDQLVLKRKGGRWPVPTDDWQEQTSCGATQSASAAVHYTGAPSTLENSNTTQLNITLRLHLIYSTTATPADMHCMLAVAIAGNYQHAT